MDHFYSVYDTKDSAYEYCDVENKDIIKDYFKDSFFYISYCEKIIFVYNNNLYGCSLRVNSDYLILEISGYAVNSYYYLENCFDNICYCKTFLLQREKYLYNYILKYLSEDFIINGIDDKENYGCINKYIHVYLLANYYDSIQFRQIVGDKYDVIVLEKV